MERMELQQLTKDIMSSHSNVCEEIGELASDIEKRNDNFEEDFISNRIEFIKDEKENKEGFVGIAENETEMVDNMKGRLSNGIVSENVCDIDNGKKIAMNNELNGDVELKEGVVEGISCKIDDNSTDNYGLAETTDDADINNTVKNEELSIMVWGTKEETGSVDQTTYYSSTDVDPRSTDESDLDSSYQRFYYSPTGYTTSELDTTDLYEFETTDTCELDATGLTDYSSTGIEGGGEDMSNLEFEGAEEIGKSPFDVGINTSENSNEDLSEKDIASHEAHSFEVTETDSQGVRFESLGDNPEDKRNMSEYMYPSVSDTTYPSTLTSISDCTFTSMYDTSQTDSMAVCEDCKQNFSSILETTDCDSDFSYYVCAECNHCRMTESAAICGTDGIDPYDRSVEQINEREMENTRMIEVANEVFASDDSLTRNGLKEKPNASRALMTELVLTENQTDLVSEVDNEQKSDVANVFEEGNIDSSQQEVGEEPHANKTEDQIMFDKDISEVKSQQSLEQENKCTVSPRSETFLREFTSSVISIIKGSSNGELKPDVISHLGEGDAISDREAKKVKITKFSDDGSSETGVREMLEFKEAVVNISESEKVDILASREDAVTDNKSLRTDIEMLVDEMCREIAERLSLSDQMIELPIPEALLENPCNPDLPKIKTVNEPHDTVDNTGEVKDGAEHSVEVKMDHIEERFCGDECETHFVDNLDIIEEEDKADKFEACPYARDSHLNSLVHTICADVMDQAMKELESLSSCDEQFEEAVEFIECNSDDHNVGKSEVVAGQQLTVELEGYPSEDLQKDGETPYHGHVRIRQVPVTLEIDCDEAVNVETADAENGDINDVNYSYGNELPDTKKGDLEELGHSEHEACDNKDIEVVKASSGIEIGNLPEKCVYLIEKDSVEEENEVNDDCYGSKGEKEEIQTDTDAVDDACNELLKFNPDENLVEKSIDIVGEHQLLLVGLLHV